MTMFNPPHPGSILKEDLLPELGIGVTEAAIQLGVSRVALSRVINGRAAISADMALRLEAWMTSGKHDKNRALPLHRFQSLMRLN